MSETNNILVLSAALGRQIRSEGSVAYPNECCGAMIGHDEPAPGGGTRRIVEQLEPLANSFEAKEQHHRFSLDSRDLARVERFAGERGKAVLGFYHSHPDHPARPSEYDRQHAWPFYSYVIVEIAKGHSADLTSWLLDEQTEAFVQQRVEET